MVGNSRNATNAANAASVTIATNTTNARVRFESLLRLEFSGFFFFIWHFLEFLRK